MAKPAALSERVEITYLGTLRIVVLIVATIFVVTAVYLLLDGGRRIATSTSVTPEPVTVAPSEVLQGVATKKEGASDPSASPATQSDPDKQKVDAFKKGVFAAYYRNYVAISQRFRKPEDPVLTVDQLAEGLGYTAEAYKGGADETVRLFFNDADYAAQINAAAVALTADARIAGQLARYRTAQKTSQVCGTEFEARRMWDSNGTGCADWYRFPVGCPVIRQIPVERCHPAYPAGITSPADAFAEMDRGFRATWTERAAKAQAEASAKRLERQATKASGPPMLLLAAQVFAGFLVVMFLFLVVAMERHLRRMSKLAAQAPEPEYRNALQAAE